MFAYSILLDHMARNLKWDAVKGGSEKERSYLKSYHYGESEASQLEHGFYSVMVQDEWMMQSFMIVLDHSNTCLRDGQYIFVVE